MKIYDITRPLHRTTAPWPGDTPFEHRLTWTIAEGGVVNVGAVSMGTHNGTHADAPFHYLEDGATIDALDPELFLGSAVVADVTMAGGTIGEDALAEALRQVESEKVLRLLLKTNGWRDSTRFPERLPLLAPDVPTRLGSAGVRLLGVDVPSVDAIDSKTLPIHHALATENICIMESLDLSAVPAGVYELIALPLRIVGGDASPIRAVLRSRGS